MRTRRRRLRGAVARVRNSMGTIDRCVREFSILVGVEHVRTETRMGWADRAKEALRRGETVTIRPRGHSMRPKVNDGDQVTLEPCRPEHLIVGDIVLVHVGGSDYLHLVKAIDGPRLQIGNNQGRINGWVGPSAIYGRATKIEPA